MKNKSNKNTRCVGNHIVDIPGAIGQRILQAFGKECEKQTGNKPPDQMQPENPAKECPGDKQHGM